MDDGENVIGLFYFGLLDLYFPQTNTSKVFFKGLRCERLERLAVNFITSHIELIHVGNHPSGLRGL